MTTAQELRKLVPSDIKILEIRQDSEVRVIVDVEEMAVPYTIAFDGHTVIKSLVDRSELIEPLTPGIHRLGWAFSHMLKGWKHTISVKVEKKKAEVLESRSEAKKDSDHSVGIAFIVVTAR
jgi:hypothetical protein